MDYKKHLENKEKPIASFKFHLFFIRLFLRWTKGSAGVGF